MENPYQSPEEPRTPFGASPSAEFDRRPPGLVRHVRVVAILMLVQGALELFAALGLGLMATVMPRAMQADLQHVEKAPPLPPNFFAIFTAVYGVMAAAALVAAVLHIAAGLQNYRFRGRVLGIVALAGGLVTLMTCYCIPTALGLCVYGLIVYLNGAVSEAFVMGESGCSSSEILTAFHR